MRKSIKLTTILAASCLVASCQPAETASSTSNQPASVTTTPRPPTVDEEADQQAKDYWHNLLSKCGDSYFWLEEGSGMGTARVFEAKDPLTVKTSGTAPQQRQLSRAEQLNQTGQP